MRNSTLSLPAPIGIFFLFFIPYVALAKSQCVSPPSSVLPYDGWHVNNAAISHDAQYLAVNSAISSTSTRTTIWASNTGHIQFQANSGEFKEIKFSPDSSLVGLLGNVIHLQVVRVADGNMRTFYTMDGYDMRSFVFSKDASKVYASIYNDLGGESRIQIIDLITGDSTYSENLKIGQTSGIVIGDNSNELYIFSEYRNSEHLRFIHRFTVEAQVISPVYFNASEIPISTTFTPIGFLDDSTLVARNGYREESLKAFRFDLPVTPYLCGGASLRCFGPSEVDVIFSEPVSIDRSKGLTVALGRSESDGLINKIQLIGKDGSIFLEKPIPDQQVHAAILANGKILYVNDKADFCN